MHMNDNARIAIRWLAIADLALYIIVLIGVLVGAVHSDSAGYKGQIPCPTPNSCPHDLLNVSVHPVLLIGIILAGVISGLSLGSSGTRRAWRMVLIILTVLLVLSPIALYLTREDTALLVMSVVAALASLIALVATFGGRMNRGS
jgi:hypothetical protein